MTTTKTKRKTELKTDWKQFFNFEKQLLQYLAEMKFLTGNKDELAYQQSEYRNSILERPPKFIHACISLEGDAAKIAKVEADIEELKSLFLAVSNTSNFPSRFPQLLSPTPLQINLSQHDAYRSNVVPASDSKKKLYGAEFIQVKRYELDQIDLVNEDLAALANIGIKAQITDKSFGKILTVSINDLMYYANAIGTAKSINGDIYHAKTVGTATQLTVREHSGMQYTARIRFPESFTAVRMSYSLLVVRDDCTVLDSLPQGKRTHRLEITKEKLVLPIECDAEIFIKES